MGAVATGAGFALEEKSTGMAACRTFNSPLTQSELQSRSDSRSDAFWAARSQSLQRLIENPYLGISLGFAAMCGAVASLALAYTGSF